MVRGAGRPLAWEGKLVNILSQRGGQRTKENATGPRQKLDGLPFQDIQLAVDGVVRPGRSGSVG